MTSAGRTLVSGYPILGLVLLGLIAVVGGVAGLFSDDGFFLEGMLFLALFVIGLFMVVPYVFGRCLLSGSATAAALVLAACGGAVLWQIYVWLTYPSISNVLVHVVIFLLNLNITFCLLSPNAWRWLLLGLR